MIFELFELFEIWTLWILNSLDFELFEGARSKRTLQGDKEKGREWDKDEQKGKGREGGEELWRGGRWQKGAT